jgi:hypothetical protein
MGHGLLPQLHRGEYGHGRQHDLAAQVHDARWVGNHIIVERNSGAKRRRGDGHAARLGRADRRRSQVHIIRILRIGHR